MTALQRELEEGARQEGVAAKVHGHDPVFAVLHEVDGYDVRWAEGQPVIGLVGGEIDVPWPLRLNEDL